MAGFVVCPPLSNLSCSPLQIGRLGQNGLDFAPGAVLLVLQAVASCPEASCPVVASCLVVASCPGASRESLAEAFLVGSLVEPFLVEAFLDSLAEAFLAAREESLAALDIQAEAFHVADGLGGLDGLDSQEGEGLLVACPPADQLGVACLAFAARHRLAVALALDMDTAAEHQKLRGRQAQPGFDIADRDNWRLLVVEQERRSLCLKRLQALSLGHSFPATRRLSRGDDACVDVCDGRACLDFDHGNHGIRCPSPPDDAHDVFVSDRAISIVLSFSSCPTWTLNDSSRHRTPPCLTSPLGSSSCLPCSPGC